MSSSDTTTNTPSATKKGSPKTKIKSTVVYSSSNPSILEIIFGGISLLSFTATWISSIFSPFILYYAIRTANYTLTTILLIVVTLAYAPWSNTAFIPTLFRNFIATNHPKYYKSCSITFQEKIPSSSSSSSSNTTDKKNEDDSDTKKSSVIPNEDDSKIFYAIHPHGIFCLGWSILFHSPLFAKVRFCFSPVLYLSPFFRLFSRSIGLPAYADKASMCKYMKQGLCIALPPGGFEEATITTTVKDRVYIKKRAGFVKLCLKYGYKQIVPVYCFGEKDTFWNLQGFWNFRIKTLNGLGIPAIVPFGLGLCPILPKRSAGGLHVVAGAPLELPDLGGRDPTREEVSEWHGKYVEALSELIEGYKEEYPDRVVSTTMDGDDGSKTLLDLEVW